MMIQNIYSFPSFPVVLMPNSNPTTLEEFLKEKEKIEFLNSRIGRASLFIDSCIIFVNVTVESLVEKRPLSR